MINNIITKYIMYNKIEFEIIKIIEKELEDCEEEWHSLHNNDELSNKEKHLQILQYCHTLKTLKELRFKTLRMINEQSKFISNFREDEILIKTILNKKKLNNEINYIFDQ